MNASHLVTIRACSLTAAARRSILVASVVCGSAFCVAPSSRAEQIVNVGTNWSLTLEAGSSAQVTASVANVGDAFAEINGFALAFVLVPVSGAGSLTIDAFDAPASNPLLTQDPPDYFLLPSSTLTAPVTISGNDYSDYYPVSGGNTTDFNELLAVSETRNLGVLTFSAPEGTLGTWNVYLANQSSAVSSRSRTNPAIESAFSDLPATDGSFVLAGTVQVVPEPSTMALVAVGGSIFGIIATRRRRGRHTASD